MDTVHQTNSLNNLANKQTVPGNHETNETINKYLLA